MHHQNAALVMAVSETEQNIEAVLLQSALRNFFQTGTMSLCQKSGGVG
jgi:hypothetical protein